MSTHNSCLGPPLKVWLNRLDQEGFQVGVRERLLVHALLARLAAAGDLPESVSLEDKLRIAGPLVCSKPAQQRKYASLLKEFALGYSGAADVDVAPDAHDLSKSQRKTWKLQFRDIAIAGMLLSAIGFGVCWLTRPESVIVQQSQSESPTIATSTLPTTSPPVKSGPARSINALAPTTPISKSPLPAWWAAPARTGLVVLSWTFAVGLAWLAWGRWRRQLYLQRVRTDKEIEEHFLTDPNPVKIEPSPAIIRIASRTMRQRYAGDRVILDIPATLKATMLAGSALAPRYRALTQTPEYLVLIDQRHLADHHAAYSEALVATLIRNGVAVQVQYFEGSPQTGCWRVRGGPGGLERFGLTSFSDIASRFTGHRLLIFAEAQALVNEMDGSLRSWTRYLRAFPQRAWFTPMPLASWGQLEQVADEQGFLVLPVQPESLHTMAGWFSAGQLGLDVGADWPLNYPPMLRGEEVAWVVRQTAPPSATQEDLLFQLRNYLGAQRFQWLCACAIFPAVVPTITLALGRELTADSRSLALGVAAIGALPWFRHAFMPSWLRIALINGLDESHETRFRQIVEERLSDALEDGSGSRLLTLHQSRRRLSAWFRRRRGLARDVVLIDFLHRGTISKLVQKLPEALRRRLFPDGIPAYGMTTGVIWSFFVGLLLLAGLLYALSVMPDPAVSPPPSREQPPQEQPLQAIQGWTEQDRIQWYHTSAGTQLIPYDWFVGLEDEPLMNSFARTGIVADATHPDKLPIGFAKTETSNASPPVVGLTCAFCHTTQFTYKGEQLRIEGGPSLQYNARFLQTLIESLAGLIPPDTFLEQFPTKVPEKFLLFATRVFHRDARTLPPENLKALRAGLTTFTERFIAGGKDPSPGGWGPGRFDALGRGGNTVFVPLNPDNFRPANAPVSIPALWGVSEYDWVQWGGSIQHPLARNVAQVIGVNAGLFAWAKSSSSLPSEKRETFRSSVDIAALKTLEDIARRLQPPRWPSTFPAINRELAARGKDLYHGNKGKGLSNLCAHCHVASRIESPHPTGPSLHVTMVPQKEVGTDSLYLENFANRSVDLERLGEGRRSAKEASQLVTTELMALSGAADDPEYRHLTNKWRDDPQYIARPHLAVWATAPFLHNGSVPNLYALLSPAKERPTCFYLSPNMEFDPVKVGYVETECGGSTTYRDLLGGFEFKTQLPGNSNQGHEFRGSNCNVAARTAGTLGCELPVADRWAIIEYLKTCDLDRLVIRNAPPCHDLE